MSPETTDRAELKTRLMQRIEDGGALGIEAHEKVLLEISNYIDELAARHLEAYKAATTERMREWHRGMWEAYMHASGIVNRGEIDVPRDP